MITKTRLRTNWWLARASAAVRRVAYAALVTLVATSGLHAKTNVMGWTAYHVAGNSFPGDTLVATPDGQRRIEDLRPGDQVLAWSELDQQTRAEPVTDLILSHHPQTIVTLTLESGESLRATGGHPIHTPSGWRAAQLLEAGGQLDIKGPDGQLRQATIAKVAQHTETVAVYNLEVANAHTFFVGEGGVLAHNARRGCIPMRTHRKNWEKKHDKPWPKTDDGKNFHGDHINPLADGGADTLDNIRPVHPDDHRRHHMENGDFKRWGARSGKGRP